MKIWIIEVGHTLRGGNLFWEFWGAVGSRERAEKMMRKLWPSRERIRACEYNLSTGKWCGYALDARNLPHEKAEAGGERGK